ncbi:MAG: hypothetical protein PVI21_01420 [Candidatus Woesebacteria bacterium]|jgi:hypothetical protein
MRNQTSTQPTNPKQIMVSLLYAVMIITELTLAGLAAPSGQAVAYITVTFVGAFFPVMVYKKLPSDSEFKAMTSRNKLFNILFCAGFIVIVIAVLHGKYEIVAPALAPIIISSWLKKPKRRR